MDGSKDLVCVLCLIIVPIAAMVSLMSFSGLVKGCAKSKTSAMTFGISTGLGLSCSIPLYHTWLYWITLTAFPFFLCLAFSMLALLFVLAIRDADKTQNDISKEHANAEGQPNGRP